MSNEPQPDTPEPARARPSWRRRCARLALTAVLLVINAVLGLYLLRHALLERPLLQRVAVELGDALDADVTIDELGGNWLSLLQLRGLQVRGRPGAVIERIEDAELDADVDWLQLLRGDLAGLRQARLRARKIQLAPFAGSAGETETGGGFPDLSPLRDLAPRGLQISADELLVTGHDHRLRGPLEVTLQPGRGERVVVMRYGGHRLQARVAPSVATHASVHLEIAGVEPILGLLGVPSPVTGGRLVADLDATSAPPGLYGRVTLAGARRHGREIRASSAELGLDADWLRVYAVDAELPGLIAHARQLTLPLAERADALDRLAGAVDLEIEDLTPYADLLPAEVSQLMPIRGHVQGRVGDGELLLEQCRIRGNGVSLLIRSGQLPLHAEQLSGRLSFRLRIPRPRLFALPGAGRWRLQGELLGSVTGSLATPELRGALKLGAGTTAGLSWASAGATLTFAGGVLQADDLVAEQLQPDGLDRPSTLRGRVVVDLSQAGHTRIEHDLRARAAPVWLGFYAGLDPELWQRLGDAELTASGSIDIGDAAFPALAEKISLRGLQLDHRLAIDVDGSVQLTGDGQLGFEPLSVTGAAGVTARGHLALAGGEHDLSLELDALDTAPWVDTLGLARVPAGTYRGTLQLRGTRARPTGNVDLTAELAEPGSLLADVWPRQLGAPPSGAVAVALRGALDQRLRIDELKVETGDAPTRLRVDARGNVGLALVDGALAAVPGQDDELRAELRLESPGPDGSAPLALRGALLARDDELRLRLADLRIGPGTAQGEVALGGGPRAWLAPGWPGTAPLSGSVVVDSLALHQLPPAWLAPAEIGGSVTATVELGGTPDAPRPRARIDLTEGRLAWRGTPPIDGIEAELTLDAGSAVLSRLTARLLGGTLQAGATLRTAATWFDRDSLAPARIHVDGHIDLDGLELDKVLAKPLGLSALGGSVGGHIAIAGSAAAPVPSGTLQLDGLSAGVGGDQLLAGLRATIAVDASGARLSLPRATIAGGQVDGQLQLRAAAAELLNGTAAIGDAPLSLRLALDGVDLAALPKALTGLEVLQGRLSGTVEVGGSVDAPAPTGSLRISDGALKTASGPRLERMTARLEATPEHLEVLELSGMLGADPVAAEGTLVAAAPWPAHFDSAEITARILGQNVLLYRASGVKLRADAALNVSGTPADLRVEGTVQVRSGKLIKHISLIPDLAARGGAALEEGLVLGGLAGPIGRAMRLDIAVFTDSPIVIRTNLLEADLRTELNVRGTAANPHFEGNVASQHGVLQFPGSKLRLQNLLLTFSPERPAFPQMLVQASGKRHGIDVSLTIKGDYARPEVLLTSSPPVPAQELVVLLSTGALPATLREMGPNQRLTLIGTYLAHEIYDVYFGSTSTEAGDSFVDRIRLESGREVSTHGQETWLFEVGITDHFVLQAERDVYEDFNMGVGYRIRF